MRPVEIRPRTLVGVLAVAAFTVSLMQSVIIPILPDLPSLFGVSFDDASWLASAPLLAVAIAVPRRANPARRSSKPVSMLREVTTAEGVG